MNRPSRFVLPLPVVVGLFLCTGGDAQAVIITWGDEIKDVGEFENRPPDNIGLPISHERVGYVYEYVDLLWILDLWTWGGRWCTHNGGDHYYEIDEATAALLLGVDESDLSKPFSYSYPPILICLIICLILFVGFVIFAILFSIFGDPDDGVESAQPEDGVSTLPESSSEPTVPVTTQSMANMDTFNEGFAQPMKPVKTRSFAQSFRTSTETTGSPRVESGVQIGQSESVDKIYVLKEGKKYGPLSFDQLTGLIQSGQVTSDDQFWADGMSQWQKVARLLH